MCRQQAVADNEKLRQLQEAEAALEADAVAAANAVAYRNELRHRLEIQARHCCSAKSQQTEYAGLGRSALPLCQLPTGVENIAVAMLPCHVQHAALFMTSGGPEAAFSSSYLLQL